MKTLTIGNEAIAIELMKRTFARLGVSLAPNKVFGPTQVLEFLGIILDSDLMEARLSEEKVHKLQVLISSMQPRRKCTKRQLLSLIGSLSFSTKVIVPGHPFLSCLIKLSTTLRQMDHFVYLKRDKGRPCNVVTFPTGLEWEVFLP